MCILLSFPQWWVAGKSGGNSKYRVTYHDTVACSEAHHRILRHLDGPSSVSFLYDIGTCSVNILFQKWKQWDLFRNWMHPS
ncbi:hypothetical protein Hanom_Chr04g00320091 [Helianthus anomalus]